MTIASEDKSPNVNAESVLQLLFRTGKLNSWCKRTAMEDTMLKYTTQRGILVSNDELQQAADRFRRNSGLSNANQTLSWLEARKWTVLDFEAWIEQGLLRDKVCEHVTKDRVPTVFERHTDEFAIAELDQLIVSRNDLANEIVAQCQEGADFFSFLRMDGIQYASRPYFRRELSAAVAESVFKSELGDVIGPVATKAGFQVLRIRSLKSPVLDEVTHNYIRDRLFRIWLRRRLHASAKVQREDSTNPSEFGAFDGAEQE